MAETVVPRGAFELRLRDLPPVSGVNTLKVNLGVDERLESGIATVMSRGDDAALGARIHDAFGIVLPSGPRRVSNGVEAFTGIGPGVWLATFEKAGPLWLPNWRRRGRDWLPWRTRQALMPYSASREMSPARFSLVGRSSILIRLC